MEHGVLRQPQALPIVTSDYGTRKNGSKYFWGQGKVITHDGEDFGRGKFVPIIDAFEGTKKITALEFYPMKFHHDESALRKRLIARGKKYLSLHENPCCRDYPLSYAIGENQLLPQRTDKDPEKINVGNSYRDTSFVC